MYDHLALPQKNKRKWHLDFLASFFWDASLFEKLTF